MLTAITIWVLLLAAGTFMVLFLKENSAKNEIRRSSVRIITKLHRELDSSRKAWEEGMDDQQEIYEQQFLTLNENAAIRETRIANLEEELREALRIKAVHEANCLPMLDMDFIVENAKSLFWDNGDSTKSE